MQCVEKILVYVHVMTSWSTDPKKLERRYDLIYCIGQKVWGHVLLTSPYIRAL